MSKDIKLKPCPFCGVEGTLHSDWKDGTDPEKDRYYWALCDNNSCGVSCFTDADNSYSKAEVIKLWNKRILSIRSGDESINI